MWYIYVLISLKDKRTYVGSTNNIDRRFSEHTRGLVKSTKYRRPLKLIYTETFDAQTTARERERYLKTTSGRRKLKVIFTTYCGVV